MEGKRHRFLGNKAALLRKAVAGLCENPGDHPKREYVRGLCDALHGSQDGEVLKAIHVARQVIIAVQEE